MPHVLVLFFFFKQKSAYELRSSDWSSDVCSSDLSIWSPCRKKKATGTANVSSLISVWRSATALRRASIACATPAVCRCLLKTAHLPFMWRALPVLTAMTAATKRNAPAIANATRSEEHTSELQSLIRTTDARFFLE